MKEKRKRERSDSSPLAVGQKAQNYRNPNTSRDSNRFDQRLESPKGDDKIGRKDEEGYLITKKNMQLKNYTLFDEIGKGTFGTVVEAVDRGRRVAVKIVKSIRKYTEAARREIEILKVLKRNDSSNRSHCIQLLDNFVFQGHVCLVFPLLSQSLYDYFESTSFTPFSLRQIQDFGLQLLKAVKYMHDLGIIHTDLKPENLMLESNETVEVEFKNSRKHKRKILQNTKIFLIDFGSAVRRNDQHAPIVSTRHYRAPEIVLGLNWGFSCDIWSIGCILLELYIGTPLFQTHDDLEHLKMMELVLGSFPTFMCKTTKYPEFFKDGKVAYPSNDTPKSSINFMATVNSLEACISPRNNMEKDFLLLIRALLDFSPRQRLMAREALGQAFFGNLPT